ncbi:uncharacterized protein LOC112126191 [Cimex lectularius]|uniref:Uncharacterized protein n=1 Tax=Cimex lectularius TaxID=79782 RepID=A0A8I6SD63_CIMLE|nr:uncharacterized protein LOC112126191 [Cimex lectularius]
MFSTKADSGRRTATPLSPEVCKMSLSASVGVGDSSGVEVLTKKSFLILSHNKLRKMKVAILLFVVLFVSLAAGQAFWRAVPVQKEVQNNKIPVDSRFEASDGWITRDFNFNNQPPNSFF